MSGDEFFLRSVANETSGIFSAALIFSFVLSFVSRQKKEQIPFCEKKNLKKIGCFVRFDKLSILAIALKSYFLFFTLIPRSIHSRHNNFI